MPDVGRIIAEALLDAKGEKRPDARLSTPLPEQRMALQMRYRAWTTSAVVTPGMCVRFKPGFSPWRSDKQPPALLLLRLLNPQDPGDRAMMMEIAKRSADRVDGVMISIDQEGNGVNYHTADLRVLEPDPEAFNS